MNKKELKHRYTLPIVMYCKLSIAAFAVILTSCNKELRNPNANINTSEINEDRYVEIAKKNLKTAIASLGSRYKSFGTPDWDNKNFSTLDSRKNILVVPLKDYDVNVSYTKYMNAKGVRNLIFSRVYENKMNIEIVELHPDDPQDNYKSPQDYSASFTGYLLTYSLENNLIQGHHRTKGVADKVMKVPNTIFENYK